MITAIFIFFVLTALVWGAIIGIQRLTGKQALSLTKTVVYAIISSALAILLLFGFVTVF